MYHATDYEIINGHRSEQIPIRSGYFKSVQQINEYQAILKQLFAPDGCDLLVNYKCLIQNHVKWQ